MAPSDLLNVAGAAQYLGVSTGTIYTLTAQGKLAHYRSGQGRGTIRYDQADLDAFIASSRKSAAGERQPAKVPYAPKGPLRHVQPRAPKSRKSKGGR